MNTKALFTLSYGMYIVSSKKEGNFNGLIVNTVFQTTSEPKTVAVTVNKQNLTHEYIAESKAFTISVLEKDTPLKLIGTFGFKTGRDIDKFININYRIGVTGIPIVLENAISYFEVKLINSFDVGTHTIFIGEIIECDTLMEAEPMTYAYYHEVKGGKSPEKAPTYYKSEKKEVINMSKYVCTVCGYEYDPAQGDPDSGIKPGTSFEDIPEDWVCPVCGVGKDSFEKVG